MSFSNIVISAAQALDNARAAGKNRTYPKAGDDRAEEMLIIPSVQPRFSIRPGETVFTIGSCFAREIEEYLTGFTVPTQGLKLGPELVDGRPNSILNEYNAGSMAQRIEWAVAGRDTTAIAGLTTAMEGGEVDLLLSKGLAVSNDQLMQVRSLIDSVYSALPAADCVILTLGMTEVWRDEETGLYLNRIPNPREMRRSAGRYSFVNFTPDGCYQQMAQAIQRLKAAGVAKVLVTVSPVPLASTFERRDCVISNSYSKATLRVVADMLTRDFDFVDYFPSYEIVQSGGLESYLPDHIHVKPIVVKRIMRHLIANYVES
ncbi:GSCFA domain-containing protein [Paracoccus sp. S1E-3]|uniref:GSCFA domain-containing protein n=1 Tax=Paracoccus sp. S1E-3 TaxID=2756130 RepID=UPI0015EEB28A|nr:GSCFA domain-containing protein [Paracoccus sp. S1E-3]MBA4491260.1 GSCFA domain-containing protein [Paracoccus sp. S1E-3]